MTTATETPTSALRVAVAVVELTGGDAIARCVSAMSAEADLEEVWVALRGSDGEPNSDRVIADAGRTVPERRRAAALAICNQADIVLLLEDTTLPAPGFVAVLRDEFADPAVEVVWGPVQASKTLSARYRALARLEYGRFDGSRRDIDAPPGNCLAVRCRSLEEYCLTHPEGLVEADVARWLAKRGTISCSEAFASTYYAEDPYGASLSTRFAHGRLYGGTRPSSRGAGRRLADAVKAFALPVVLTARGIGATLRGGSIADAASELPWMTAMATAWSAGEATGALFGPGNSHEAWT